jgi:hypothetical protein
MALRLRGDLRGWLQARWAAAARRRRGIVRALWPGSAHGVQRPGRPGVVVGGLAPHLPGRIDQSTRMAHPEQQLSTVLAELLEREHSAAGLTLGEVFQRIGDRGFGLLLIVLSLPSALPVPAPGYSTPFGVLIAVLALQMLAGRTTPWLPQRAARLKLSGKFIDVMLSFLSRFFGKVEFLIRPRLQWVGSRAGRAFLGALVLIMACLMILPIPLTNTAPAFVILLTGIGLTEEDGLFSIFAGVLGVVATALYTVVLYLFIRFGLEGIVMIKDGVKAALRLGG